MVPANDFHRQWSETSGDVLDAVRAVGESGWYVLGREVEAFESELGEFWGLDHVVGVASGLDALELSLRALGCKAGDRVLTSPISAFATVLAIVRLDAVPVFADCDDTGLVDLDACRRILEDDGSIRYFVPVHLFGQALDLEDLRELKARFSLTVVEDCAQSIGASSRGLATGTIGDAAATSFYPTKNLGALGDGGAVLTRSREVADSLRVLRDYGQARKYRHTTLGYNSRLDELHAAIMRRAHLPRLRGWVDARRHVADTYRREIGSPHLRVVPGPPGSSSSCHLFPVQVLPEHKADALAFLRDRGIGVAEHYPLPQNEQEALGQVAWRGDTPRAAAFCRSEISLPIHPYMTSAEVRQVIEVCNSWRP